MPNCTHAQSRALQSLSFDYLPPSSKSRLDRTDFRGHIAVSELVNRGRLRMSARLLLGLAIVSLLPFATGCSTMSNTGKGALAGGAIGAGTGALIGQAAGGKAGPGAIIGGAAGALVGGAIGNEEDRREREALNNRVNQAEAQAAATRNHLGMADVMQLAKDGHSDDVIINQIQTTGSTYDLSTEDLRMLRANGVSDAVIKEMQNHRPNAYRRPRYVAVPAGPPVIYGPPPPVYFVAPPPPPPVFGVGFHVR